MDERELKNIAHDCLLTSYGIEGSLTRLPGENFNFSVVGTDGSIHVFKIVDSQMPADVLAMQHAAIEHAICAGFLPKLPRFIKNKDRKIKTGINLPIKGHFSSILMDFIDGTEMSTLSDISNILARKLGNTLGSFDVAMASFDHPAAHRSHRWNLAEAGQHEGKIALIEEVEKQELLVWAFARWRGVQETLRRLPWQVIHGDAHDENVLVDGERVIGLIDFGDCCYNPTVCELAICITYLMMRGEEALRTASLVVAGYQEERRLSHDELEALFPLVCARLAVSICIANQRKVIDPHNPHWFGGEEAAWKLLRALRDLEAGSFLRGLEAAV